MPKMNTLVDQGAWKGKLLREIPTEETCVVITRRIHWLFLTRLRTTVLPGADCDSRPGFIVWWNTDDPDALRRLHAGMVQTISRIGFTEPAV